LLPDAQDFRQDRTDAAHRLWQTALIYMGSGPTNPKTSDFFNRELDDGQNISRAMFVNYA
jgi:hypothetical protein